MHVIYKYTFLKATTSLCSNNYVYLVFQYSSRRKISWKILYVTHANRVRKSSVSHISASSKGRVLLETHTHTTWLYSPSSGLASCAIRLHKSLSWAFPLHPSIPIARQSSWTSSMETHRPKLKPAESIWCTLPARNLMKVNSTVSSFGDETRGMAGSDCLSAFIQATKLPQYVNHCSSKRKSHCGFFFNDEVLTEHQSHTNNHTANKQKD
jgi:hypothetical protein